MPLENLIFPRRTCLRFVQGMSTKCTGNIRFALGHPLGFPWIPLLIFFDFSWPPPRISLDFPLGFPLIFLGHPLGFPWIPLLIFFDFSWSPPRISLDLLSKGQQKSDEKNVRVELGGVHRKQKEKGRSEHSRQFSAKHALC